MSPKSSSKSLLLFVSLVLIFIIPNVSHSQSNSFSYQGFFKQNNVPANGNFYFEFALYDQSTFGSQIGPTVVLDPVAASDGLFSVNLDFGNQFNGANRYLEIRLRPSAGGPLTILTPRQLIRSVPNALNANLLGGLPPAAYIQNSTGQQANTNISISGNASVGGNIGVGTLTPNANLNIVGTQPPDNNGIGTPGLDATNAVSIVGARGGRSGEGGQGGAGASVTIRAGDGGTSPQGTIAEGQAGSISLQPGFSGNPAKNGKVLLAPTGGNVGVGTSNPQARLDVNGTALVNAATTAATLAVTNSQPGITDGSPANIPPAAIRAETTSATDPTIGVLGISNSAMGVGVIGLTNGNGTGATADATGVLAIATGSSGETRAFSADVASPNGTALDMHMTSGGTGYLIYASSGTKGSRGSQEGNSSTKFSVTSGGQVDIQGGLNLNGTFTSGQMTISNSNLQTMGNLQANTVTATQNVSVGGFLTTPGGTLQINRDVNLNGTLTPQLLGGGDNHLCNLTGTSTLRFCSSSLRYKDQVRPFTAGLEVVKRLNPVKFDWKENGLHDLGLAAEEVAKIEPLLTFNNPDGQIEGVKYAQLSVILINAIKQQQKQIENQQNQIAALTKRLNNIQNRATRKKK